MNKIFLIIQREYLTRIRRKSFLLLTLLMPILMVGLVVVPLWLGSLSGGNDRKVIVVDETHLYDSLFSSTQQFLFLHEKRMPQPSALPSDVEAVVHIKGDLSMQPSALDIVSPKEVQNDLQKHVHQVLDSAIRQQKLARYGIPELESIVSDAGSNVQINTAKWDKSGNTSASSSDAAKAAGLIFTFIIYIFILTNGAMVMQGVMEEKTNRILEIMVSSVRPFQLMMGKIIGVALVGLTQLFVWGILASVAFTVAQHFFIDAGSANVASSGILSAEHEIFSTVLNLPLAEILLMFLLFFIGGYLFFASIFAAIGAAINSQEDSSQFMSPIIILLLFSMYAATASADNTNGPLAFWASLFPLTSPVVMMVRIPFGVPLWQEILSLILLYATSFGMVMMAAKIYRVGILMYGKKPTFSDLFRWLRY